MEFFGAVFLELVQNLPLMISFVAAVWLWGREYGRQAILFLMAGSIISSLLIRFTEPSIHGYHEPIGVTVVNFVSLGLVMALFTIYLGSETKWCNWKTDLILGGLAGILVGTAQGAASPGAPIVGVAVHSLAFALSAPVALIGIRVLKTKTSLEALTGSLVITALVTIIISLVDYSYFLFGFD